ncbi:mitochondrial glycine transporter B isoform X1 [Hydra vulgaris]|uniref:mitochondrial glycine transporter B isoform X1 n=1 Tax=Hydra vulgaris TaxID=6087 RepID=UPI001F5FEE21|nr:mitochondrial glycine transporter B [Hydra vulgaris]
MLVKVKENSSQDQWAPLKSLVAGSLSGCITCLMFQPLDRVKTVMQIPRIHLEGKIPIFLSYSKYGIVNTVARIIKDEGFLSLWKGLTPSIYRQVPGSGLYFVSLHQIKNILRREPKFYENLFIGAVARSIVCTTMLPVTVIKARLESGQFVYKSVPDGFLTIWRSEGLKGLFSGCTATIARDAPFSGLFLMFYTQEKKLLSKVMDKNTAHIHFACGLIAGVLASFATHPADVIKTQIQLYPLHYQGTISCIKTVYQTFGLKGFTVGFFPRCLRRTLVTAMSWTIFEEVLKKFHINI